MVREFVKAAMEYLPAERTTHDSRCTVTLVKYLSPSPNGVNFVWGFPGLVRRSPRVNRLESECRRGSVSLGSRNGKRSDLCTQADGPSERLPRHLPEWRSQAC